MKIKFLSFAFALVVAFALVSCGETVKPTGDVEKDLKAFTEYIQKVDVKDKAALTEAEKVMEEFNKYYSDEGAGKELKDKWTEAIAKDPKATEAVTKFMEDVAKELISGEESKEESKSE